MQLRKFLESDEDEQKRHRIESASAMFQKGIYHLFVLKNINYSDAFDRTLRLYQCMFWIRVALILLDFEGEKFDRNMRKREIEWANRDPGAAILHSRAEKPTGFKKGHPLHKISQETLQLYKKVVDARHNLIYRPYYESRDMGGKSSWFWEDCTLKGLLQNIPTLDEVEQAYKEFYKSINTEIKDNDKSVLIYFKVSIWDQLNTPPLTLLLNYAHMLNSEATSGLDLQLLDEVRKYRNRLLDEDIKEKFLDNELKKLAK